MTKMKRNKRVFLGIVLCAILFVFVGSTKITSAVSKTDEAELRLIFTTDIHGQLNSVDYELGADYSNGGLARAYNLIKKARAEQQNSMTFDIGDVIYDYTTEFIYSADQSVVQPVYEAMNIVGYDAMTLGNHEFDYEFDYVKKQLEMAGLYDKVVVSNLTDSKTGTHPFKENMIITKKLATANKQKVAVKIGVIGETFPYLSTKAQDFTGVLKVETIIDNVKAQAAKLKEQGADIVVVLAHSGMGPEKPGEEDKNVAYALTKIKEVDVVLCGHEHNQFPSEDKSIAYYKLPGIDKTTNLVNGKNLVMAQDRCRSIGVVDLGLSITDGKVAISNRSSQVRKVTGENTIEEKRISSLYDVWSEPFLEYYKNVIGTVDSDALIENFHGLVEDNSAMQLLNNAKRAYALNYIHTKAPQYVKYPVIAASNYVSYGSNSYDDFVNISGDLTESDLASLQKYNGYTALYKITGKQLREWIEWSASAYEQPNGNATWYSGPMKEYMEKTGVKSLIAQEWLERWNSFYVFDGIDYEINPLAPPRYNVNGVKINTTNRVTKMTYNGEEIADNQEFVLAVGKIAKTTAANAGIEKQGVYKGYVKTQGIISEYIKQRCKLGNLVEKPDYNWTVAMPTKYQFLVSTTKMAEKQLNASDWFVKTVGKKNDYIYSIGSFPVSKTKEMPYVLLTSTKSDITSTKVRVAVAATSKYGIKELRYVKGDVDEKFSTWNVADKVTENCFYASANDIYTVYVKDNEDNISIQKINIDNIYKDALTKPRVDTYTNRKTKITGKADPNTVIIIETSNKKYETKTNTDGAFSYALPSQKSGSKVVVYAKDLENSYVSSKVTINVRRTGPNQPEVYGAFNNSDIVYGNLNDDDADVVAIIDKTVYVGNKDVAKLYENCVDLYNKEYNVVVTDVTVDGDLEYTMSLPVQRVGTDITFYTLDHLSRKSMGKKVTVKEVAPNPPELYNITCADDRIYGHVSTSNAKKKYNVYLTVGKQTFEGVTDTDGDFVIEIPKGSMKVNDTVKVYVTDKVKDVLRISYCTETTVKHPAAYVEDINELYIGELYTKATIIDGSYDPGQEVTIAIFSGNNYEAYTTQTDKEGYFNISIDQPLRAGDEVYAYTRVQHGDIVDMIHVAVELSAPETIHLEEEITNATTKVVCVTDELSTIHLKVGNKQYTATKYKYDLKTGEYVYSITITKANSKLPVTLYASNTAGKSTILKTTVVKKVPDAPKVKQVDNETTKMIGTIDVVGKTKVFAKVGKTIYEGKVSKDGKFKIEIKKCAAKTKIYVWGENKEGTGPKTSIKVVEVKKK